MKYGPIRVEQAAGKILAHNIAGMAGGKSFRKGKILTAGDIATLLDEGYASVYAAELEPGDLDEDSTACRIAQITMGAGLALKGPSTGRVSLVALYRGVLRVDAERLSQVNGCEGIAFATLPSYRIVEPGQTVATVKVIPYALPAAALDEVERVAGATPVIQVRELQPRAVGLIYAGLPSAEQKLVKSFGEPVQRRVSACGSRIAAVDSVHLTGVEDEAALAAAFRRQVEQGVDLIILANETSTMDANDSAPRAIRQAGGEVICVGAPVDPGNLLLLASIGAVPVLGVPGCVRSPKANIVDWVLPALLAGERLTRGDIARMGYGGLLEEAPRRRGSNP